jgi:UDP-glucose 4-epimerase
MANFIGEALGKTPEITVKPSRVGEVTHYVADITKARSLLGYEPRTRLREGLRLAIEWTRDHEARHASRAVGS